MKISFASPTSKATGALIVMVGEKNKLSSKAAELDKESSKTLSKALSASRFKGDCGEILEVIAPAGLDCDRVILVGAGGGKDSSALDYEKIGGNLVKKLNAIGAKQATLYVEPNAKEKEAVHLCAAQVAFGALLASYRFDKYRTKEKEDKKPSLQGFSLLVEKPGEAKKAYANLEKVAEGIFTSRDIISEPPNVIYPESFVEEAKKLADLGVVLTVLGEKEMKKLGMGALLGVGQGSERESKLLMMEWRGAEKGKKSDIPLAIVGKGVCFDTGGISLKPAGGMEDMKWDMGGAGVVIGLIHALAARKAKVNVVGVCGLVENMPDGNAQRPGDVVTSLSGQTIEVLNTDAEGRLVLCDALTHVQRTYKPKTIIDLATLTGAIMVALGKEHAGLFANDDKLSAQLTAAGLAVDEKLWRMPLHENYNRKLDCDVADMKNIGDRWGGSITAAEFLHRFIDEGVNWAHLDIAGVTWSDKDAPTVPKGATAFGVRLLNAYIEEVWEK